MGREPQMERVLELKEKMQLELRPLWVEQHHLLRKRKEQHATEVQHRLKRISHCTSVLFSTA